MCPGRLAPAISHSELVLQLTVFSNEKSIGYSPPPKQAVKECHAQGLPIVFKRYWESFCMEAFKGVLDLSLRMWHI